MKPVVITSPVRVLIDAEEGAYAQVDDVAGMLIDLAVAHEDCQCEPCSVSSEVLRFAAGLIIASTPAAGEHRR